MAKYKLALIGKNISHSKSPEIYNKLLNNQVEYHLLDYPSINEIPEMDFFSKNFDGVSITSPYKEFFIDQVELIGEAQNLKAINCLVFSQQKVYGANTDFLAIKDLLDDYLQKFKIDKFIILGDGVMSRVAEHALLAFSKTPLILSRKRTPDFHQIDLTDYVGQDYTLVINTCAREYIYNGLISNKIIFWDFNYNFSSHSEKLSSRCIYNDGFKMLELQAEYALQFWSIKKKI